MNNNKKDAKTAYRPYGYAIGKNMSLLVLVLNLDVNHQGSQILFYTLKHNAAVIHTHFLWWTYLMTQISFKTDGSFPISC